VQLSSKKLEIAPARQFIEGDAHGAGGAMVADPIEALLGEFLNIGVVRLLHSPMNVGVKTQVLVSSVRLRMVMLPSFHFLWIDIDGVSLNINPGPKLLQDLGVVVLTDAGFITEIPSMDAADEIWTVDGTVCEEGTAMKTTSVKDRDLVVVSNDDQIHVLHKGVSRDAVG
jgi:hypothetical protein